LRATFGNRPDGCCRTALRVRAHRQDKRTHIANRGRTRRVAGTAELNGYNTEVTQRAEGDASRFKSILTEYARAPGVTRDRLYLDMMQSVLTNSSKVLIDQKAGANLLQLPLERLLQQGAATPGTPEPSSAPRTTVAPTPEPAAPLDPSRAREGLRNRER
jgi:membrane protease subunit HflK